ncbi:transmembrane protein 275-like [Neoarius graeffei]|uniref:transmembrane protein 275-like n=1 Tax=Neoarius graeffei TaxID=443677 RepID=UPI00298CC83A|nr:transmembrane protein 275-like [Neoarius graeffei]
MICTEQDPHLTAAKKTRSLRPYSHPSPSLCCACGLCIMLAGINITLVGAFGFAKLLPANNPPIIIGPLLLLVALSFFGVCCMFSRQPSASSSHANGRPDHWGLMRMGGAAFEMETSEPTLQDTTAIQLSPTNTLCSSHHSSSTHLPAVMLHPLEIGNLPNGSHSSCQLSPREDMILLSSYEIQNLGSSTRY